MKEGGSEGGRRRKWWREEVKERESEGQIGRKLRRKRKIAIEGGTKGRRK